MYECPAPSRRAIAVALFVIAVTIPGLAAISPASAQCSCHPWADQVVASTSAAANAQRVLGPPDRITANFEDLNGQPGFVTVAFGPDVIADGPGDDLIVHLVDFTVSDWVEAFELYVSSDGTYWVSLGLVQPTTTVANLSEARRFDLFGSGLDSVTQVRVVNSTVDPLHINEGPDLDAFEVLHCAGEPDGDLLACQDDLDACTTELDTCELELDDARDLAEQCDLDLEAALESLDQCAEDLEQAGNAAEACAGDLDEAVRGLREIERLLGLPPGQRQSDFRCSGQACEAVLRVIRMLVVPPGQGIRANAPRR